MRSMVASQAFNKDQMTCVIQCFFFTYDGASSLLDLLDTYTLLDFYCRVDLVKPRFKRGFKEVEMRFYE